MINVSNSVLTLTLLYNIQPCPSDPVPAKSSDPVQLKHDAFGESSSLSYSVTTVKSLNKRHFGTSHLSFIWRLASFRGQ